MLQIDFWQLVGFGASLLTGFAGVIAAAGRIIATQFEKRIDERFDALQRGRAEEAQTISSLEREFLKFRAELPVEYVRREDYVRGQSIVEAKLDGLAVKIDNVILRSAAENRSHP